jgi:hypothetical protein
MHNKCTRFALLKSEIRIAIYSIDHLAQPNSRRRAFVEAAELMAAPDFAAMCRQLEQELPLERIIFELPGYWLPGVRYDSIIVMIGKLFRLFGPQVNLANLLPEVVLAIQDQRLRIGTSIRLKQASTPA